MRLRKAQQDKAPNIQGETDSEKILCTYKLIDQLWSKISKLEYDVDKIKTELNI